VIEVYNRIVRALVVVVLVACGSRPPPAPEPQPPIAQEPAPEPETPARIDIPVGEGPMSLAIADGDLVWTDSAGAIWTMREGGDAKQLSDQHGTGFMFHPVAAGLSIFVSGKRDFARVTPATGDVKKLGLGLPEDPVDVVATANEIFVTLFKRNEVIAIPIAGGAPRTLFSIPRGVLAHHGSTLYAVSYTTGVLMAVPGGAKPRTIAGGFVRPTALAVDDTHAYVYGERDKSIRRVELASGTQTVIATNLENADDLVADGAHLYTYSWPSTFVRIAKDGSRKDVLANDLKSPRDIAVTADAVYVVSRDQNKIVRFRK
jgi:hypothetical protein